MAEGRGNRHHPRNLQGVLQMAVEAGSASEDPAPREPMTQRLEKLIMLLLNSSANRHAISEMCPDRFTSVFCYVDVSVAY